MWLLFRNVKTRNRKPVKKLCSDPATEISYTSAGVARYGTKGSIRVDYEVYAGGKVVQVFDLKPSDFISPTWVQKASRYIQLSADEVKVISYEAFKE